MKLVHRVVLVSLLASPTVLSQGRVWIVDQSNGAGTNFTDMPAAVTAARDGDLIRVRAGTYSAFTTSKALTIQHANGTATATLRSVTIQGLSAGKLFVMEGMAVGALFGSEQALVVTNCAGRVILDRIDLLSTGGLSSPITGSAAVQLNGCQIRGGGQGTPSGPAPLRIDTSHVALTSCRIEGATASFLGVPAGSPAATANSSVVSLAHCVVLGGGIPSGAGSVMPGLVLTGSTVTISGDATARVAAGTSPIVVGNASAIVTTGGALTIDPSVQLQPAGNAPAIASTNTLVSFVALPALKASGAAPGGTVTADLFSSAGDIVLLMTSLPGGPLSAGLGEDLWLDPATLIVLAVGVQGASRHTTLSIPLANDANLSFGAWSQQAVSGTFLGGFRLSNPASYSLN